MARRITLLPGKQTFVMHFLYDLDVVEAVKKIPGRSFHEPTKTWRVPIREASLVPVVDFALAHKFTFEAGVEDAVMAAFEQYEQLRVASKAKEAVLEIPGLGGTLRPFQAAGVQYAMATERCFIGDQMGLGKTPMALATLLAMEAFPAVIVCPASLRFNWLRESLKWLPTKSVEILEGKDDPSEWATDIAIIGYETAAKNRKIRDDENPKLFTKLFYWVAELRNRALEAVVLDESHCVKNNKADRSVGCRQLMKKVRVRLCLSGTAILNRPSELIHQLQVLGRLDDIGGYQHFIHRYCGWVQTPFGQDISGATHLTELHDRLRACCYIRRTKEEVLTELPEKQRCVVEMPLSNRKEYDEQEADLYTYLKESRESGDDDTAQTIVRINALLQLCAKGKMAALKEWVTTFLDSGEKLVMFGHHLFLTKGLGKDFNAPTITGEDSMTQRQAGVDRFQTDPECRLIVCNLAAGGVGLTLTAASNVAICELGWTPALMDQAEDRVHRIGQKNAVVVWYLLAQNTIEVTIAQTLENKRDVISKTLDGKAHLSESSVLNEFIDGFLKKRRRK